MTAHTYSRSQLLVLFDFDGTICDSFKGVLSSYQYLFATLNKGTLVPERLRENMGLSLRSNLERFFPGEPEPAIATMVQIFLEHHLREGIRLYQVFPGTHQLLKSLNDLGIECAIVSNKTQASLDLAVPQLNLTPFFTAAVGQNPHQPTPKATKIKVLLEELNPARATLIGDTSEDRSAAETSGVGFIAVNWGYEKFGNEIAVCTSWDEVKKRLLDKTQGDR